MSRVISFIYLLLALTMMMFMAGISWAYFASSSTSPSPSASQTMSPIVSQAIEIESQMTKSAQYEHRNGFKLYGLQTQVSLNEPLEAQLTNLWYRLYDFKVQHQIALTDVVQLWQATDENSAIVTLGVTAVLGAENLIAVDVPAGLYLKTPSLLMTWQSPTLHQLTFAHDYELLTLNSNFEVVSQESYVHIQGQP